MLFSKMCAGIARLPRCSARRLLFVRSNDTLCWVRLSAGNIWRSQNLKLTFRRRPVHTGSKVNRKQSRLQRDFSWLVVLAAQLFDSRGIHKIAIVLRSQVKPCDLALQVRATSTLPNHLRRGWVPK
jgi:hypothetical protein